jgi:hypothetical protein
MNIPHPPFFSNESTACQSKRKFHGLLGMMGHGNGSLKDNWQAQ